MKSTVLLFLLIFISVQHISGDDDVYLTIEQGTLCGAWVKSVVGEYYYSFKAIPYARAPVGKLRFKAPQPPESWDGVRDATEHGPECPQVEPFRRMYLPGSEDCLFVNVYTPNLTPRKLLPVIVAIPGGAFRFGSGNDYNYGPDFLVAKDMVVVTINYRLDALGFLDMGTCKVPGNAGLKDQVAALKWVQNNIECFGGDPKRVTILGESAAAACVSYHLLSPMSKGLFQRGIIMSGSPISDWNVNFMPERRPFLLAKDLGFETRNKTELLNFLQSVPYRKLINTTTEVMASETKTNVIFKMIPFPPVIERECPRDSFITRDPIEILKSRNVNKADVMFGYTSQESLLGLPYYETGILNQYSRFPEMFVPSVILKSSTPDQILHLSDKIKQYFFCDKPVTKENIVEFINYANSASFVYATQKFARMWPAVGRRYFYKFSSYSNRNYYGLKAARYGITGASHWDDIFYLFDPKGYNLTFEIDSEEYRLIQQFVTPIANFVKYGNPTPDRSLGIIWPQYNTSSLACVEFTDKLTVRYAPDEDDYNFWESIFEEAGITF